MFKNNIKSSFSVWKLSFGIYLTEMKIRWDFIEIIILLGSKLPIANTIALNGWSCPNHFERSIFKKFQFCTLLSVSNQTPSISVFIASKCNQFYITSIHTKRLNHAPKEKKTNMEHTCASAQLIGHLCFHF